MLLCAALALWYWRRSRAWQQSDAPWPLYASRPLPRPEQVLYLRLVSALPGQMVLADVRATAVFGVRLGSDQRLWNRRLRDLHYDYVVCGQDATVRAAITLHDPSCIHVAAYADALRQRACAAAGVRLVRWSSKALPDVQSIRAAFADLLVPSFEESAHSANASWWSPAARDPT